MVIAEKMIDRKSLKTKKFNPEYAILIVPLVILVKIASLPHT